MDERREMIHQFEDNIRFLIKNFQRDLGEIFKNEITFHEFLFLKHLGDGKPQMVSSLSKKMKVTASYATAVVDKLLQKGYINRERSSKDRRIVELTITEQGIELIKKMDEKKTDYMSEQLESISDSELEILNLLLNKIGK
ncbi:MarR family winged helix-turn-helix transcriptional regulator [Scopulibacillus cellulosilyticus]|uniref:MarR family winged helix-turn-helix transcriptional regulator n=1 Tax=Scopulibacillus cellulosilyticus TaxID=2665665 RepID=A0ABW2PSN2_9BACL